MRAGDTIVAVASAPGRSARAMVRVSGPGTGALVRDCLHAANVKHRRGSVGCFATTLVMGSHAAPLELPVLVSLYRRPRSYTGEDSAEIQVPGSPALVERVLGR